MARRVTESDVARPSGLSDADIRAAASEILAGESGKSGYQRLAPFLGPAFIASVAYVDPGNFATNIQAGAEFGYLLIWVIVASNLMAMLIQSLSAKLGIATGRNLAEVCREQFPTPVVWGMWILAEVRRDGDRPGRVPRRGARVQPALRHPALPGRAADRRSRPS